MRITKGFLVGSGVLALLVMAAGLAYASDPPPDREPETSPFFEATLQQAVDELDGKVTAPGPGADLRAPAPYPTQHYTGDSRVWPECGPEGYTWDLVQWPKCHYTSDPEDQDCYEPYPTQDYTSNPKLWDECEPRFTKSPSEPACTDRNYTQEPRQWPWCDKAYTTDVRVGPECHYTSDPEMNECHTPYPTQDYTSNPTLWEECKPGYTTSATDNTCEDPDYTRDTGQWPWCEAGYTFEPPLWPHCHYTSDPGDDDCTRSWPTKDYTWDSDLWKRCGDKITQDAEGWWCDPRWTHDPELALCDPTFTWQPDGGPQCHTDYTYDPELPDCDKFGYYTSTPNGWDECAYPTADARLWPECHYTSDPGNWTECGKDKPFPTKDYTTDPRIWDECVVDEPPNYTTDPAGWPTCHYTSDPVSWTDCKKPLADLGDAPDSTNHTASGMTAYPAVAAKYPTVFDPATGLPEGPKHWKPRADAWLGPWVTLENDADLLPDEDTVANLDPPGDMPDRDRADDGLLYPVKLDNCVSTVVSYTLTVAPGAPVNRRFVNVWFDWNRDGDWGDALTCTLAGDAPEWAVQNHIVTLGPGVHVLQTPAFLPANQSPGDPIWMRISVADGPAPLVPGTALADGRGSPNGYQYGETEDYRLAEQKPDYDIYLKDNWADNGSVPTVGITYRSPDLWVRNDGDCTKPAHQNPAPGTTTTICVRVRNRMAATVTNITVDVYWASAALGLWWPGSFSYIGAVNIPSLAGGALTVKPLAWSVPSITGHFCLLARADATEDPIGSGPDTVPPVDNVRNNNNIVQRNTNIVDYPEVTQCGFTSTQKDTDKVFFDAVNPKIVPLTVSIVFDSADFPLGPNAMIIELGSLWGGWASLTNFSQVGQTLQPTAFPATIGGIVMAAHETAPMSMTITAEIDQGFTVTVEERAGSTTIGGIDYVRKIPVCSYLPLVMKNARQ
jgi:hypothetical protein